MFRDLQRADYLILLGVGLGTTLLFWMFLELGSARAGYLDAADQLRESEMLATEIRALRDSQSVAGRTGTESPLTSQAIATILKHSGISEGKLVNLRRSSTHIPNVDYKQEDAVLNLRGVSMEQICRILNDSELSRMSVTATSLSLSWSNENAPVQLSRELWDVELVLTHLIYHATRAQK